MQDATRKRVFFSVLLGALSASVLLVVLVIAEYQGSSPRPEWNKGSFHVSGSLIAASDISTTPDVAISDGIVLFIPNHSLSALRASENNKVAIEDSQMGYMAFVFKNSESLKYISGKSVVDSLGHFTVDLKPGDYIVCAANLGQSSPDHLPYVVQGCFRVKIDRDLNFNISTGEGGVRRSDTPPTVDASRAVQVTTDKSSYHGGEVVVVTIANGLSVPTYALTG